MVVKKIAIAACFASALTVVSAPASAAAYFIGGKWYFFSLDFNAELAKVTGKDLNDGTKVVANVTVTESNIQCANPQGKLVDPGNGPKVVASGTSPLLTDADFLRADRKKGNIYTKTASVPLPPDPVANPCKDPAGVAEWLPTYWRYQSCNRATDTTYPNACYAERAVKINGVNGPLTYITGGPVLDPENWTFVYLPTVFTYVATVQTGAVNPLDPTLIGTCRFPANNEFGARLPGQPYSLSNPPVNGWGATQVDYVCSGLPAPD